ncbi:MAG: PEGA domain-containing protein [Candidatus Doudnabacteria bacterium]|nr:PEGA domain-containing protein [Candidatus Doudnabacteria bacterium]
MTLKSRIVLIVCGLVIFLILAPTAVFLARGYTFDFENKRLVKTGALVVKTEPKGAEVFLNGKSLGKTNLTRRFVRPGEYHLEISATGFEAWRKKITVHEQLVAYAPSDKSKIYLFSQNKTQTPLATNTLDFITKDSDIFLLKPDKILRTSNTGSGMQEIFATSTTAFQNLTITDFAANSLRQSHLLLGFSENSWFINSNSAALLPPGYTNPKLKRDSDNIYALNAQNQLTELDHSGNPKILRDKVQNFNAEYGLYYISLATSTPQFLQMVSEKEDKVLLDNMPLFSQSQIIVSPDRQIFLLLDTDLYQVADKLVKINGNVKFAFWDEQGKCLLYGNDHEVWIFDPLGSERNVLVTRSAENLRQAVFNIETGYLFVATSNNIKAIEFDKSGQPNVYTMIETENPITKFAVNPEADSLIYLAAQNLYSLKIR